LLVAIKPVHHLKLNLLPLLSQSKEAFKGLLNQTELRAAAAANGFQRARMLQIKSNMNL
jgi:hypothetical protein